MYLKRIYKEGPNGPELNYISLAHTGTTPEQNFSVKLVTELVTKGIMEISGDELIFHVHPEDLHYEILRKPGRYCLQCGEKLPADISGELARLHVATEHAGELITDPSNPSGYVNLTWFECVLNEKQHKRFRKQGHPAVAHFPLKEADNG